MLKTIVCCLTGIIMLMNVYGQQNNDIHTNDPLGKTIAAIDAQVKQRPLEKIYLQTNQPWYNINDTIWFKAYVFEAAYLNATSKSGLLYINLINDSNKVVRKMLYPIEQGLCRGHFPLPEDDITPRHYTLVAYTNWLQNFGQEYFYKQSVYVGASSNNLMVKSYQKIVNNNGKEELHIQLHLSSQNRTSEFKKVRLLLQDDSNKLLKETIAPIADSGIVIANFPVTDKSNPLKLTVQEYSIEKDGSIVTFPISLNRPNKIDLQFLPEGGQLLADRTNRIGFKALSEDGRGIPVRGKILDNQQQEVATFTTLKYGMGSCIFKPKAGEIYTARVTHNNGSFSDYKLPEATKGISLQVENEQQNDSLTVYINNNTDISQNLRLLGVSRNIVCFAKTITAEKTTTRIAIDKAQFPTDVAHLILLNNTNQPISERLTFIQHHDELNIQLIPHKKLYATRDSVALQLVVSDKSQEPVEGSFSLSVTDDGQLQTDTANNILAYTLLSSHLKGYIENAGYYFSQTNEAWQALDNLLLTQGWVGYNWQEILQAPKQIIFPPEYEFSVSGRISNLLNKPVANTKMQLISTRPALILDTITNKEGRFSFTGFPPMDTAAFLIKAIKDDGKNTSLGVEIDPVKPAAATHLSPTTPWHVNTDSAFLQETLATAKRFELTDTTPMKGSKLQDVVVVGRKRIKKSKNLNGDGNADIVLNEMDLWKAGKKTLLDLLKENVKGIRLVSKLRVGKPGVDYYLYIYNRPVIMAFDGEATTEMPTGDSFFGLPRTPVNIESLLNNYMAEDIAGIEVMMSPRYEGNYDATYLTSNEQMAMGAGKQIRPAWIEVTTRTGLGPHMKLEGGSYYLKPLFPTWPRQFYSPAYAIKDANPLPDFRSTIYWQPDIITDSSGKATIHFYTSNNTGKYTILVNGSNMDGLLGTQRATIEIKND